MPTMAEEIVSIEDIKTIYSSKKSGFKVRFFFA